MSAIAGRILILPKGEYDATLTYEFLDLVNHNGRSWLAKKSSTGVEPTDANSEYWQPFGASIIPDGLTVEINADGEISVIDSPKLGGKDASEYVTGDEELGTSILEKALTLSKGVYNYHFKSTPSDLPVDSYKYGSATIFVRKENAILVVLWGINVTSTPIATNFYNGTAWSGWSKYATLTDLANYLPLSGGTIETNGAQPLGIKRANSDINVGLRFEGLNGILGSLGFLSTDKPMFLPSSGSGSKELLHTGNKPSGTYTGNGQNGERSILTGGIGNVICIRGNGFLTFLYYNLAFCVNSSGVVRSLSDGKIYFINGLLSTFSDDESINKAGVEYEYTVL